MKYIQCTATGTLSGLQQFKVATAVGQWSSAPLFGLTFTPNIFPDATLYLFVTDLEAEDLMN